MIQNIYEPKLHINMKIPNHRVMCELFNEEYKKDTSAKNKKEKRWKRFFKWRKEGRAYIIEEIYEKVRPESLNKNDKYSEHIWTGIAFYLHQKMCDSAFFSKYALLTCCGFVSKYWSSDVALKKYSSSHKYTYSEAKYQLNTLEGHVSSFCVKSHLIPSLKKLSEKGYITYEEKIIIEANSISRDATEEEIVLYHKIIEEYKESKGLVYTNSYDWGAINKLLKKKMEIQNLDRIRKVYNISLIWSPFDDEMDEDTIESIAHESLWAVNDKSIAYMQGRVKKDVAKSTWNYLMYSYGPNPGTSMIIAPEKTQAIREQDRMDLISTFIEITYDDVYLPF